MSLACNTHNYHRRCFGRNDWGQLGSGDGSNNLGDSTNEMGDNLERVQLVAIGANVTVSALAAHNGPCVIMQSSVAVKVALKCWGPNGYGNLGVVSFFFFHRRGQWCLWPGAT